MTAARKSQRSVTYLLGPTQFHHGHSLGVNVLEFGEKYNELFSAGRDGIVASWTSKKPFEEIDYPLDDLDRKLNNYNSIHDYLTTAYDDESELIFLESQIRKGCNFNLPKYGDYQLQNHAQIHSDWINDIKLLADNKSIVSCSSDLSLKVWDSSKSKPATVIGYHADYVKCLAYHSSKPTQIISGSLDKTIAIWDIEKQHQITSIKNSENETGSVYALSCLPNIVCSGGPEDVIKLYDSRSNALKPLNKFLGHQGNIKGLILKNNYLLSGSADSTLKLWCLRTNRVLRTFDMHESSVWSIECPKEENNSDDFFNVFYSGDKNGLVVKTDLKVCNYDYYYSNNSMVTGKLNDNLGISTVIADLSDSLISDDPEASNNESTGVLSLKFGDNSIWSSSSSKMSTMQGEGNNSFIKRWAIPNTNKLVTYQAIKLLRNLSSYNKDVSSAPMVNEPTDISTISVLSDPFHANNIVSEDLYDLVSHLSNNSTFEISQLDDSLALPNGQSVPLDDPQNYSLLSPFLSTNGGPNLEFAVNSTKSDSEDSFEEEERLIILDNPPHTLAIRTIPIAVDPLQEIEGQSGLVKHRLLNNRKNVVTMDTSGTIKVWDLIKCCSLESIEASGIELKNYNETADYLDYRFNDIIDKYQTNETLPMWCKVEIKSGKLFITLDESTFSNTEIYLDQLFTEFPLLEEQYAQKFSKDELEEKRISYRVNLGEMVLKNIFRKFVKIELLLDIEYRNAKNPNTSISTELMTVLSLNTIDLNLRDSVLDKVDTNTILPISSNDNTKVQEPVQAPAAPLLTKKASNDDHKRKFKFFGKSSRSGSTSSTVNNSKVDTSTATMVALGITKESGEGGQGDSAYSVIQEVRAKYDSSAKVLKSQLDIGELELPFINLSKDSDILIIVSEMTNKSSHELFHGTLDDYLTNETLPIFEKILPRWCGNALLLSKFPTLSYTKINFIIEKLPATDKAPNDLSGITNSSNKLNAVSVLRAHKIAAFIIDRLDERPVEADKPGFKVYEFLELVCMDQIIPFDMTLATIKARIWKKSGDVMLYYRQKT